MSQARKAPTAIILTGERQSRRHLVQLNGRTVGLTDDAFTLLCELAIADADNPGSFLPCAKYRVQRLRRALDSAGQSLGHRLIVNSGFKSGYRLALADRQVQLGERFEELTVGVLDVTIRKPLLRHFQKTGRH